MKQREIKKITVIGTGVIGTGWIARFLAHGYYVVATDPAPDAEKRMYAALERAWTSLERQGLSKHASIDNVEFIQDFEAAVTQADFVQENVPERLELKRTVLQQVDTYTPEHTLIASSTSGFKPTHLQENCLRHPERIFVAHPFNPVYLLPLVEIVGGNKTSSDALQRAQAFYELVGMKPLLLTNEIEGHVADRLMEALWREALHLVNDGVATTEEIDASIVYGAGMRWALMGPFLTFHLAGGEGGMRHMLDQFGPALELPWTKLKAPDLTESLKEQIIAGTEKQTEGVSISELEARRDQFLIELQQLLDKYWPAANVTGRL